MAKNTRREKPSQETVAEAMRIARANQRPGQTKEQTRLIAQGIQKGIDQYKKQHKARAREMDRQRKKATTAAPPEEARAVSQEQPAAGKRGAWLPWILLGISWAGFVLYLVFVAK